MSLLNGPLATTKVVAKKAIEDTPNTGLLGLLTNPTKPSNAIMAADSLKDIQSTGPLTGLLSYVPGVDEAVLQPTKQIWSTPVGSIADLVAYTTGSIFGARAALKAYPKFEKKVVDRLATSKLNNSPIMRRIARNLEKQTYINLKDNPKFSNKILESATNPVGTFESNAIAAALKGLVYLKVPTLMYAPAYMSAGQQLKTGTKRLISPLFKKSKDLKITREAASIPLADTATEHLARRRWLIDDLKRKTDATKLDDKMRGSVGYKKVKYFFEKGKAPRVKEVTPYDNIIKREPDPSNFSDRITGLMEAFGKGRRGPQS